MSRAKRTVKRPVISASDAEAEADAEMDRTTQHAVINQTYRARR